MFSSIYSTQNAQTCNMPDYFTHSILADVIYERLRPADRQLIPDRSLYKLGAQGGDVFFMYTLRMSSNLGRWLHTLSAAEVFEKLKGASPSYVAGYATHYALDSTIHPAVYAFESTSKARFAHLAFEKDLGLYVSRKYSTPRKIMPREEVCNAAPAIYDAVKRLKDDVTFPNVERCMRRYFTYTRAIYTRKKQTYKFDYDYSSLSPVLEEAVEKGIKCVECVISNDIKDELFSESFLQH